MVIRNTQKNTHKKPTKNIIKSRWNQQNQNIETKPNERGKSDLKNKSWRKLEYATWKSKEHNRAQTTTLCESVFVSARACVCRRRAWPPTVLRRSWRWQRTGGASGPNGQPALAPAEGEWCHRNATVSNRGRSVCSTHTNMYVKMDAMTAL